MLKFTKFKAADWLIALLAFVLLAYTFYRAITLSFTHDESFSYTRYVLLSYYEILKFVHPTANNHLLNTLLMKLLSSLFGSSELVLRLPNLLGHCLFLGSSFFILKKYNSGILLVASFILLNFNSYFLDFFSLARGYGMAHGLLMLATYKLYLFMQMQKKSQLFWANFLAALAVFSNLVLLHFYVSILFISALLLLQQNWQKRQKFNFSEFFKSLPPVFFVALILAALIFEPVRKLVISSELYGRGTQGFWYDTVWLSLHAWFLGVNYFATQLKWAFAVVLLTLAGSFVLAFIVLRKNKFQLAKIPAALPFFLLILSAGSSVLQHGLFGSEFLTGRIALFLFPLYLLSLVFLLNSLKIKILQTKNLLFAFALIVALHFLKTANFTHAGDWKYDCSTKKMLHDLEKDVQKTKPQLPVSLSINWLFEPTINFYRQSRQLNWLQAVNREGLKPESDYSYLLAEDADFLIKNRKDTIIYYPINAAFLVK